MEEPGAWDEPEKAQAKMKLLGSLKEDVEGYRKLVSEKEDLEVLLELAEEEPDPAYIPEANEMLNSFRKLLNGNRRSGRNSWKSSVNFRRRRRLF